MRRQRTPRSTFASGLIALLALTSALLAVPAVASESLTRTAAFDLMRAGGVAVLMRHGQTEPGIGDPPQFTLDNCATQRNLSDAGRAELRGMSARLAGAKVRVARAYSSRWCRALESARLLMGAQGAVEPWPALDSQFANNTVIPGANTQVVEKVRHLPRGETWLLMTHQVNITALTGVSPAPGEAVLVKPAADGMVVIGRVKF